MLIYFLLFVCCCCRFYFPLNFLPDTLSFCTSLWVLFAEIYFNPNNFAKNPETTLEHPPRICILKPIEVQLCQPEFHNSILLALNILVILKDTLGLLVIIYGLVHPSPLRTHFPLLIVIVRKLDVHSVTAAELKNVSEGLLRVLLHFLIVALFLVYSD